ncbi:MAG: acetylornithine aminotransferase [Actinobacteria bacterium BACL15 MAG-120619-bin91]|jgi:acetylornithine/N-succinyldiaminopimelate aminotransferase|uniref:Acetylornithine aminotransferase n=2 Tax=ac1 cluster TaxID=1655545 RepID=A0A0R2PGM4_9ACTN|nr:MAG: acetylornithine aminotransferase [Actinobacteria bacterium BACL15 MAG-120619-bin91]KRO37061.1 MAG: acetylornithine aminotransferase [Actinobacteria bacterium BACL15 MAG-120823-bin78]
MTNKTMINRWKSSVQNNYGTPSIALVKGKGLVVTDADGKQYLDFLGGIATNILGHAHSAIIKAVTKQVSTLSHVSNFYVHPQAVELAEELAAMTSDKSAKVFFCQSGAEANEAALKLSRRTGKVRIVAAQGAFHGRTMGALSMTGQPAKREPFLPLVKGVKHVPFGDIEAMRKAITKKTAMVILEPIMGEAGVIVPPADYLREVRALCDAKGALLVIDAVQTGMGRTGDWFGYEYSGITPDVITLAKGLGGGLPLGAMIALGKAADLFQPGDHGSTFGGNPVTTAAGLAAIKFMESQKILKKVEKQGVYLMTELAVIPGVAEVRGAGLLLGIELETKKASDVALALQNEGVLVNAANPTTIRIAPALIVTDAQLKKFVSIFKKVMSDGK